MEPTSGDIEAFLSSITPQRRAQDARTMLELMSSVTGVEPQLWGSIIGFGSYHYSYRSGRQGDAPAAGFAARKQAITVYLPEGLEAHSERLTRLGRHSTGVGCLYLPRLDEVDISVLRSILTASYETVAAPGFGTADSGPASSDTASSGPANLGPGTKTS